MFRIQLNVGFWMNICIENTLDSAKHTLSEIIEEVYYRNFSFCCGYNYIMLRVVDGVDVEVYRDFDELSEKDRITDTIWTKYGF